MKNTKKKTAVVVSGISSNLEKAQRKSEPAPALPKSREATAANPAVAKVWKWARRVVLGYDRNP